MGEAAQQHVDRVGHGRRTRKSFSNTSVTASAGAEADQRRLDDAPRAALRPGVPFEGGGEGEDEERAASQKGSRPTSTPA